MNRYRILKHPELEPCTSEQAFVKEVEDIIKKEVRKIFEGNDSGTRGAPEGLASISGIEDIQMIGDHTLQFTYDQKTWSVAL
jgi:hypothetical protein